MSQNKRACLFVDNKDLAKLLSGEVIINASPKLTNLKVIEQVKLSPANQIGLVIEADELEEIQPDRPFPRLKFAPIITRR